MGDIDKGSTAFGVQLLQLDPHFHAQFGVEVGQGFMELQNRCPDSQFAARSYAARVRIGFKHHADTAASRRHGETGCCIEDASVSDINGACGRRFKPSYHAHGRCFAAAGWAHEGEDFSLGNGRIQCGHCNILAKALLDFIQNDTGHGFSLKPGSAEGARDQRAEQCDGDQNQRDGIGKLFHCEVHEANGNRREHFRARR